MKEETFNLNSDGIKRAIVKRALGYDVEEVVEEYAQSKEGEIVLTKKKVTLKNVPPDVSALKILIDLGDGEKVESLSDEELNAEKQRLLKLLQVENEIIKEKEKCKKALKTKKKTLRC